MSNIEDTLKERGSNYGTFEGNAQLTQDLKSIYKEHIRAIGKQDLPAIHQEAIDMIFHKLSRIANGDPSFLDSWVDIVGYAQLVVNKLKEDALKLV